MWERLLDGALAVLFFGISALMCSYLVVCAGAGINLLCLVLTIWSRTKKKA